MPHMTITISTMHPFGPVRRSIEGLRYVRNRLDGVISGKVPSNLVTYKFNDTVAVGDEAYAGPAAGVLISSGGAGTQTATIGAAATAVAVTWATSDIISAGLMATAIRANTTVNRTVTATNYTGQITLASVAAGATITILNTTFTAVTNAAAIKAFGQFNIDGTDTQDAAALALAMNRHPSLAKIRAVSSGAVVYFAPIEHRAATPFECVTNPGAGFTANRPIAILSNVCMVQAIDLGPIGNEVKIVPTGTGLSFASNGVATFLGGGAGGATVANRLVIAP